jgi:hypothetical protein
MGTTLRHLSAQILTCSSQHLLAPSSIGCLRSQCSSFPKGVSSSSRRPSPASLPQQVALRLGVARHRLLPDCSLTIIQKCPLPRSQILFLLQSSCPTWLLFYPYRDAALPLLLQCIMGGHLLALTQLGSTLHCLHVPPHCSILEGMASTTANACSMFVLPWLHRGGTFPKIMGGSSAPPPPMTLATTIMATVALLCTMGGIRLPNFLHQCMGGIMLLLEIYPCLCTVAHPFPRAMGGIPMQLHWLPRAWRLWAHCITLLCRRRITVPPLYLTLPCHFPALVKACLLLSHTIPCLLLLLLLLGQRCSSSTPSRMQRLTWMLWE